MAFFKPFTPYKLNYKLIGDSKFEIHDKKTNIATEKTFNEVIIDIFGDDGDKDVPYKYETDWVGGVDPGLLLEQGDKKILIKERGDSGWGYLMQILRIMLETGKDFFENELENVWLFVEHDSLVEDVCEYRYFFIANGCCGKILNQHAQLAGNMPDNLLEVRSDYFKESDQAEEMARIRRCYEKFYRETEYGQLIALRKRNEFDLANFGELKPEIDNPNTYFLVLLINKLQTELKTITWFIIFTIIFLVLRGIFLLFK